MWDKLSATSVMSVLCLMIGNASDATAQETREYNIGLAGAQSMAYGAGGGLAELLSRNSELGKFSAQTTKGYAANIRLVDSGDSDMGLSATPLFHEALRGEGQYDESHQNIRAVMPVWPANLHCIAFENSGIQEQSDLAGKRISVGLQATSGAVVAELLLEEAGFTDDVDIVYANPTQSVNAMRDGKLDVMCANSGGPYPAFISLSGRGLILIPWETETLERAASKAPGRSVFPIEAGTYDWQENDAPSIGHWSFLFANEAVPADVIEDVVSIMNSEDGRAYLATVADGWKYMPTDPKADVLESIGFPLHEGAVRYWSSQGVELPEIELAAQAE